MSKRALLIGIDHYPNLKANEQLTGCVNDARLWADVLRERFGFASADMTVLIDGAAKRDAILQGFEALVNGAQSGDTVVVTYSGHGSWMTDREGDELDGRDETILPVDTGRAPHENRDITDDEIGAWLARLTARTTNVTLIFDCCHSGTITRDAFGGRIRSVRGDDRPVAELPPSPLGPLPRATDPGGLAHRVDGYVLLAACAEDETAQEHWQGLFVRQGALTYFLAREIMRAPAGATYRDVMDAAAPQVSAIYITQHPRIEGTVDRELFGTADRLPMAFFTVTGRAGATATLAAGAAHGVARGSRWAVYPAQTRTVAVGTPPLARLTIATVNPTTATGALSDELAPGAVSGGARAVLVDPGPEQATLAVEVVGSHELETLLAQGRPLLRSGTPADVRCYRLDARPDGDGGPVPQLGALSTPTLAAVGRDGRLLVPAQAVGAGRAEADAAQVLLGDLQRVAHYRNALAVENEDASSALRGRVDLVLLRRSDAAGWEPAATDPSRGMPLFLAGESIAFEVANDSDATVYISILDFGLTYRIFKAYPPGASEALAPGRRVPVRVAAGHEITLGFPDRYPFAPEPGDTDDEGVETVRMFATAAASDFGGLTQQSVGAGARDMVDTGGDDWTVVTRRFLLRRA